MGQSDRVGDSDRGRGGSSTTLCGDVWSQPWSLVLSELGVSLAAGELLFTWPSFFQHFEE